MGQETVDISKVLGDLPDDLPAEQRWALVLLWSRDEPQRVGEVAILSPTPDPIELGRGDEGQGLRTSWARQRPGQTTSTGPLEAPTLSRSQLRLQQTPRALEAANLGRGKLLKNGAPATGAVTLEPGDVLEVSQRLVLLVTRRPETLPGTAPSKHPFGQPDRHGVVGESPAAWKLREQVAFLAQRADHVLVRGPSGTGKELVAQALHRGSTRGKQALVSRNAATIPATLMDAELFGNAKNYPNPGQAERPGLVGEASGSTLFLDEFAELPVEQQAHLLRVLDSGEYHRLGEAKARQADLRLVAATNRPDTAFKSDVLARFKLRLEVPGLGARPEDVPLVARHLLRRIASEDPQLAERFFPEGDPEGFPRLAPGLITALVRHGYRTHVRELETLLWRAILQGHGDVLDAPTDMEPDASDEGQVSTDDPAQPEVDPNSLSAEEIQACLDKHEGRQEPVWKELGLSSRHVLTRLVKKHGLQVRGRGG